MKTFLRSTSTLLLAAASALCAAGTLNAATLPNRLSRSAALTAPKDLPQGVSPRVRASTSLGHLNADTRLESMSLVLPPSAAQSAALDQLLADQQNPASPRYHQWLTPEQFGAQFGVSDADLQVLQNWLTNQGLQVLSIAPSRNQITFSGTSGTVEAAFHTELNRFRRGGQSFFENSTAPQMPAALQGVVSAITGLSSFRPAPRLRRAAPQTARPEYTTATGTHYLTPYDFRQIYNANSLFNSGYTGSGVKIAVVGQSAVDTAQLGFFQQLTGQTVKAPTLMLVPNSGPSTVSSGDEAESESDLEYTSGVAPGATILYVYTGVTPSTSTQPAPNVNDALNYAIIHNVAPILSYSYGSCETENPLATLLAQESYYREASAQGQTILAASGDTGAAGCEDPGVTVAFDGLQVDYPASSPYVTGIGGTTLNDGANGGTYWSSTNNSMGGSALGYIPETTWNDNSIAPLSSGGGGVSRVFGKPSWQAGTGVPADGARDVPDISFSAASQEHAYVVCTSDAEFVNGTASGKCSSTAFGNGRVGGTSLPTPSFAGALAMVLNANNRTSGLGNLNPLLYSLYGTNASIFHDITSGNNTDPCTAGSLNCAGGVEGYSATPGYDLTTGLGSLDIGAFNTNLSAGVAGTSKTPTVALTTVGATTSAIQVQIRVTSNTGSTAPTGSVVATLDGGSAQTIALGPSMSTDGTPNYGASATVTFSGTFTAGNHTVAVTYGGDTNFDTASASTALTASSTTGGLQLTATPTTLTINSSTAHSGSWTLNVASVNGYSGIVFLDDIVGRGQTFPASGCLLGQEDAGLPANGTIPITVTYSYSSSDCSGAGVLRSFGNTRGAGKNLRSANTGTRSGVPLLAIGFTGLLGSAFLRRRRAGLSIVMTGLMAVAALAGTAGLSGCGSSSSSSIAPPTGTTSTAPKGTYNFSFIAEDYANSSPSSTVNVTLVIQ